MKIANFSMYRLENMSVVNTRTGKTVTQTTTKKGEKRLKLKDDTRGWRSVALAEVLANAGISLELPKTSLPIHNSNGEYFIDITGEVYSFSKKSRQGFILKHHVGTNGYLKVTIMYKGKRRNCEVHKLVAETFIMHDYTTKKLCCMHKDNNKTNCHLDNLVVGTYSQNNKDAYTDNLNKGNLEWRTTPKK